MIQPERRMSIPEKLAVSLVKRRYLVLTALCAVLYLTNLGGYRLFDVDEPRYAETARRMVESGEWIVPYFNGEFRFEKPVLTYWLIGAAYETFGFSEFSSRLSAAACAWGTVLLTCLLGSILIAPGAGLTAGVVLALSLQFVALGRMALTDMPLTFFFTSCLAFFLLADREEHSSRARFFYSGSFFACALAVLTKGPVGLVLPGAIILLYLLLSGNLRRGLSRIPWTGGILVLFAVSLPWYLWVNLRSDWEFHRVFILQHNIQRFAGEVAPGGQHVEPFWYYLPALLAGMYPWSFFSLQALWSPLRDTAVRLRRGLRERHALLFPLVWSLGVLAFFSLSRAKLPTYITPVFPPLSILLAAWWQRRLDNARRELTPSLAIPAWIGAAVASCAGLFLLLKAEKLTGFSLGSLPVSGASALVMGPLAGLILLLRKKPLGAFAAQSAGQVVFILFLALAVLPLVSEHRQEPQVELLAQAREYTGTEGTLSAYRYRKTAMVYYSGRVVKFLEAHESALFDSLDTPLAVITRERHLAELLQAAPELGVLARSKDLVLLGKK